MGRVRSRKRVQYQTRRRRRRRNTYRYMNKKSVATHSTPTSAESCTSTPEKELSSNHVSCTTVEESEIPSTATTESGGISPPTKRLRTNDDEPTTSVGGSDKEEVAACNTWIDFNAELCLAKIPYVLPVFDVWRWCRQIWTQSFESLKDRVFPYRVYHRELQLTIDKVQQLEEELNLLKNNKIVMSPKESKTFECKCPCRSSTPVFLPQCSTVTLPSSTMGATSSFAVPPPPPPAAPPPPPPPPRNPQDLL
ncbi:uncharacterized protein [Amphiura filiformis]|uniref:uncharacterized protein isoform X2 n=1 Tax=Amphiura filiformis TaxID=82378 RepID=UPI003B217ECD